MAAADVERAPARHVLGHEREQGLCRGPPPVLLGEVGVVAHVAVEVVQRRARGQRGLLDRPAFHAGQQVAVAPGLVRRRRERLGRDDAVVAGHVQAQEPPAQIRQAGTVNMALASPTDGGPYTPDCPDDAGASAARRADAASRASAARDASAADRRSRCPAT